MGTDGKYTFCFNNNYQPDGHKLVEFFVLGAKRTFGRDEAEAKNKVDPLDNAVQELADSMHAIKEEQQYLILREKLHRQTAESTHSRVAWWSVMQTGLLVA